MTVPLTLPSTESFEWESRKIPEATIQRYKVGMVPDGSSIIFPCYDEAQGLLGYSQRSLVDGTRKHTTRGPVCFFGIQACKSHGSLIICEGQTDTLSMSSIYPADSVVGLPGASTAKACVKLHASWLRRFKKIYIVMDGDAAGRQARKDLCEVLPSQRVHVVTLDDGMDVNQYLLDDRVDDLKRCMSMSVAIGTSRYLTRETEQQLRKALGDVTPVSTGLQAIDEMLGGGFKPAEVIGLAGYTGQGKSSLAQVMCVNVAKQGHKVVYVSEEMTELQILDRLTEIWYGSVNIPKDELEKYQDYVLDNILIRYMDDTDPKAMHIDTLSEHLKDTVQDHGIKLVVIDVLSDIERFNAADSEYNTHIMKQLQEVANGNAVTLRPPTTVLCVCHTAGSDEDEMPTASQIRGGTVVRQIMTSILTVLTDLERETTTVCLRKYPRNSQVLRKFPIVYNYSPLSRNYTPYGDNINATNKKSKQRKGVSEQLRGEVSGSTSTLGVPSKGSVPVGGTQQTEVLHGASQDSNTGTGRVTEHVSTSLQPGLLQSSNTGVLRDKGTDETSGSAEVQSCDNDTLDNTVPSSGAGITNTEVREVEPSTSQTEQRVESGKLSDADTIVRNHYLSNPHRLANDRAIAKQDEQVRARLDRLGLEAGT